MLICIKSNIWNSIQEKLEAEAEREHWGWIEKNVAYKKTYAAGFEQLIINGFI